MYIQAANTFTHTHTHTSTQEHISMEGRRGDSRSINWPCAATPSMCQLNLICTDDDDAGRVHRSGTMLVERT